MSLGSLMKCRPSMMPASSTPSVSPSCRQDIERAMNPRPSIAPPSNPQTPPLRVVPVSPHANESFVSSRPSVWP